MKSTSLPKESSISRSQWLHFGALAHTLARHQGFDREQPQNANESEQNLDGGKSRRNEKKVDIS